ncbi:MAG: hypothetical protein ABIW46_00270 [Acidimicrobiales bacterium]
MQGTYGSACTWPLELANGELLEVGKVTDEITDLRSQVAGDLLAGYDPEEVLGTDNAIDLQRTQHLASGHLHGLGPRRLEQRVR